MDQYPGSYPGSPAAFSPTCGFPRRVLAGALAGLFCRRSSRRSHLVRLNDHGRPPPPLALFCRCPLPRFAAGPAALPLEGQSSPSQPHVVRTSPRRPLRPLTRRPRPLAPPPHPACHGSPAHRARRRPAGGKNHCVLRGGQTGGRRSVQFLKGAELI